MELRRPILVALRTPLPVSEQHMVPRVSDYLGIRVWEKPLGKH